MLKLAEDLRYAVRMFERRPGYAGASVLVLTLAIGVNTAVFTFVNSVLLRPLPYPQPDRLVALAEAPRDSPPVRARRLSDRDYLELRRADRLFEHATTFDAHGVDLSGIGEPVHLPATSVTWEFFDTFGMQPALGRTFAPGEASARVVVLGNTVWRDQFGEDPNVLGRKIALDGIEHTIVGVLPPRFDFPDAAQLWMPFEVRLDQGVTFRRTVIARLKSGVSLPRAQAELQAVVGNGKLAAVRPLQEHLVSDVRQPLLIFSGAVGFVLLIGCANLASLSLTRAAARRQEIAVRAALGAPPRRILRELLAESVLLSFAGGLGGLGLATWAVPVLLSLAPAGEVPRLSEVHIDWWVVAYTLGISVIAGLVFGFAPAAKVARWPLKSTLGQNAPTLSRADGRLHGTLVAGELALALVLLTGAGLMVKSLVHLRSLDLGFRPDNVVVLRVSLPPSRYGAAAARALQSGLLHKLSALPGVSAAGSVDIAPLGDFILQAYVSSDQRPPASQGYLVDKVAVSPGYLATMRIPLLGGRDFNARDDAAALPVAIVSESIAHDLWPHDNPIGKVLKLAVTRDGHETLTVVGVVNDVRQDVGTMRFGRAVYRPYTQAVPSAFTSEVTFAVLAAAPLEELAPAIRQALHDVDPDRPVISIAAMRDVLGESMATRIFETRILGAFSLLAVLLAAIGIYGVMAYSVEARTREIGVRIALGATAAAVLRAVLWRALVLTAAGLAFGVAGALASTRVLASLLFEVNATDTATFTAVSVLVAAVAMFAGWIPARRATRVDPVAVLRHE